MFAELHPGHVKLGARFLITMFVNCCRVTCLSVNLLPVGPSGYFHGYSSGQTTHIYRLLFRTQSIVPKTFVWLTRYRVLCTLSEYFHRNNVSNTYYIILDIIMLSEYFYRNPSGSYTYGILVVLSEYFNINVVWVINVHRIRYTSGQNAHRVVYMLSEY